MSERHHADNVTGECAGFGMLPLRAIDPEHRRDYRVGKREQGKPGKHSHLASSRRSFVEDALKKTMPKPARRARQ